MNFTRKEISSMAAKKANASAVARKQKRRALFGRLMPICFQCPESHLALIQKAADIDHRTMTNFVYHAAVKLAERMTAKQ